MNPKRSKGKRAEREFYLACERAGFTPLKLHDYYHIDYIVLAKGEIWLVEVKNWSSLKNRIAKLKSQLENYLSVKKQMEEAGARVRVLVAFRIENKRFRLVPYENDRFIEEEAFIMAV